MLKEVVRERRAPDDDWPDAPLPLSAAARWRMAVMLIVLALAGLVAHLVSMLAR